MEALMYKLFPLLTLLVFNLFVVSPSLYPLLHLQALLKTYIVATIVATKIKL